MQNHFLHRHDSSTQRRKNENQYEEQKISVTKPKKNAIKKKINKNKMTSEAWQRRTHRYS